MQTQLKIGLQMIYPGENCIMWYGEKFHCLLNQQFTKAGAHVSLKAMQVADAKCMPLNKPAFVEHNKVFLVVTA